jgi:hypothetical protein
MLGAGISMSVTSSGVAFIAHGKEINLDGAPKNADGAVEMLEIKDGIVWASGVPYFDPSAGTYFRE